MSLSAGDTDDSFFASLPDLPSPPPPPPSLPFPDFLQCRFGDLEITYDAEQDCAYWYNHKSAVPVWELGALELSQLGLTREEDMNLRKQVKQRYIQNQKLASMESTDEGKNEYEDFDLGQCDIWKARAIESAVRTGIMNESTPLALLWNTTDMRRQIRDCIKAFPSHWTHTIAAKANPLAAVLQIFKEEGFGCEGASIGELCQALKVGFDVKKLVLDSPCKTKSELQLALDHDVGLVVDNLQELDRLDALLADRLQALKRDGKVWPNLLGIRLNTQVGAGRGDMAIYSTSVPWSKFGVPSKDKHDDLLQAYRDRPHLNMVHVHVGSQGYELEVICLAARVAMDFVLEVNEQAGRKQVHTIDIGGGLPVNFKSEENSPRFEDWAALLKKHVPELFSGEFNVITEYGRRMTAKQGFLLSRVEYTKEGGGRRVAIQHAGADICVRTVYKGEVWPLRITAFNASGRPYKQTAMEEYDVAGPCCIMDILPPHKRLLPVVQAGDFLAIHDTGGYYHSSYSYYNCRQTPLLGFFEETAPVQVTVVKPASTVEETLRFFS